MGSRRYVSEINRSPIILNLTALLRAFTRASAPRGERANVSDHVRPNRLVGEYTDLRGPRTIHGDSHIAGAISLPKRICFTQLNQRTSF